MAVSDRDLFLGILALDSYNRGYGAGLNDTGANDTDGLGLGGSIGNAELLAVDLPQCSEAAGFYAVAYSTPYGNVISYRGTDFTPVSDLATVGPHGWTQGGGNCIPEQRTALSA